MGELVSTLRGTPNMAQDRSQVLAATHQSHRSHTNSQQLWETLQKLLSHFLGQTCRMGQLRCCFVISLAAV